MHDMNLYQLAKDIEGEWHGSEAEQLLRDDVEEGRHKEKKPRELYLTRPQYQQFDINIFRKHIYQETRRQLDSNYWLVKKKKKEKKRRAQLEGCSKYTDDDNDFYDPVLEFKTLELWKID